MADGYTYLPEALSQEAAKWRALSDSMEPIAAAAKELELSWTAFFLGWYNVDGLTNGYYTFQRFVSEVLSQAVTEFDQIATALDRVREAYDAADAQVQLDLDKIYTE